MLHRHESDGLNFEKRNESSFLALDQKGTTWGIHHNLQQAFGMPKALQPDRHPISTRKFGKYPLLVVHFERRSHLHR